MTHDLYSFTLTIEGADTSSDAAQTALFEVGCDDATFEVSGGIQTADSDREAADFAEVLASAVKAVESTIPGARVVEVHRDQEVATGG